MQQTMLSAEELSLLNKRFEAERPAEILRWLFQESGLERVAVASAFQADGIVAMHLATQLRPDVPILFLETGFQFAETLAFKEQLTERLQLNVIELTGTYTVETQEKMFGPRLYERDPEKCCDVNKVQPMFEALREFDAWVTAFRRDSSPTRAGAPVLHRYEIEPGRSMLRVNPMVNATRGDVWSYLKDNDLPHNPLYDLGYASIGCAPCTRMQFPGEAERAGRWAGLSKWECGIHEREAREGRAIDLREQS